MSEMEQAQEFIGSLCEMLVMAHSDWTGPLPIELPESASLAKADADKIIDKIVGNRARPTIVQSRQLAVASFRRCLEIMGEMT